MCWSDVVKDAGHLHEIEHLQGQIGSGNLSQVCQRTGLLLLSPEPPSSGAVPLKPPEIYGNWRTGLLELVWIHGYHQGQGGGVASSGSTHGKDQGALGPTPWAIRESDPDTTPGGQHGHSLAEHFSPCPAVVRGMPNKKRAER